jgi:hypothetical protein
VPVPSRDAGYAAQLTEDHASQGKRCALLSGEPLKGQAFAFGNLMQSVDATPYRGQRVRFRAAVRAEVAVPGNQAQLWLRVDRKEGMTGFFDNMQDRPIIAPGRADSRPRPAVPPDRPVCARLSVRQASGQC